MIRVLLIIVCSLVPFSIFAVSLDEQAPDFTLKSVEGTNVRLEELRGEVVLINFWASWCGPCRQEMPILQKIHQRYEPLGFKLIGINVDEQQDKALRLIERLNVDFTLLLDSDQSVSESYDVNAMPYTVLLDRDGTARFVHRGYKPGDEQQYVNRLRQLLKGQHAMGED